MNGHETHTTTADERLTMGSSLANRASGIGHRAGKAAAEWGEKERRERRRDIARAAAGRNVGGGRGNRKRDGGKEAMNGDSRTRGEEEKKRREVGAVARAGDG